MSVHPKSVVYLALGPHRVRAAQQHAARLAADGSRVLLLVADVPAWAGATVADGVTVQRVGGGDPRSAQRAAKAVLLSRGGPLAGADLLIAGDPYAMPLAWAAARRRRDLAVRFEPAVEPGRRSAPADLAVVTPWYPSPNNPLAGAFVKTTLGAVGDRFDRVSILHTDDWPYPYNSPAAPAIGVAAERLMARSGNATVQDTPEGELTRVMVPITSRRDYAVWAAAHVKMLRDALPTGQIEAPLVHAHTGIYGGVVAMRLARPDARIVVTEHASFLPQVFKQPASRRLYDEMLDRVDVLVCVSQYLYDTVSAQFPHHADKLRLIPNPIDFDDFALRPTPPRDLLRWLYVGRMSEQKGVHTLLEAFARVAAEEPRATLTLVGSGPLDEAIRERVRALDMADRIELHPAVPPHEVAGVMHRHDLLVHASPMETFGMTVVEAVATGTPVLVARSQGPGETLGRLDGKAGLLVDVSDDPDVIVEGYRELRKRFDELDLTSARASLLARYGREAVAAQLRAVYAPEAPESPAAPSIAPESAAAPSIARESAAAPQAPESDLAPQAPAAARATPRAGDAGRVVLVAISPPNFNLAREFVERLTARGVGVDVITNDPALWQRAGVDRDGVRMHPLNVTENRNLVLRTERLLVFRAPGKVFSVARDRARRLDPIWPELAVSTMQRAHGRVAKGFHTSVFYRGYRTVRPHLLWRIVRRDVLPHLDLARTHRVVVAGVYGVTIGWRLARNCPGLTVTTSLAAFDPDNA